MSYSGRSVEHQSRHFARLVRSNWWTHPIFNTLDANNPSMNVSTPAARLAAYSMLLSRGVSVVAEHRRANSEWELIAVEDPHGFANLERLVHWRRVMPTINFKEGSSTTDWDGGNCRHRRPSRGSEQPGRPQHHGCSARSAGSARSHCRHRELRIPVNGTQNTDTARTRSRAPYFHNGIAPTQSDVVLHYEKHLLFVYTDHERADLVAFLNAL